MGFISSQITSKKLMVRGKEDIITHEKLIKRKLSFLVAGQFLYVIE